MLTRPSTPTEESTTRTVQSQLAHCRVSFTRQLVRLIVSFSALSADFVSSRSWCETGDRRRCAHGCCLDGVELCQTDYSGHRLVKGCRKYSVHRMHGITSPCPERGLQRGLSVRNLCDDCECHSDAQVESVTGRLRRQGLRRLRHTYRDALLVPCVLQSRFSLHTAQIMDSRPKRNLPRIPSCTTRPISCPYSVDATTI